MIPVSNTYNPYTTVRDVDIKLEFDLIESEATSGATYNINEENTVSNLNQLSSGETNTVKYATCEDNLVRLDGTWDYLPDTITTDEVTGWWSNAVSDENGEFTTNPKLTVTLDDDYNCVGFTMYTENTNIIDEFKVTTLNEDIEISEETFFGDGTNILIADLPASDFNKVEIEVTKTKEPYRRVKMLGFRVGVIKTWNRDKIVNANITEELDMSAQTLPINELTVELDNSDGAFDIFGSTYKRVYVQAMKTAYVSQTYDVDPVKAGSITKFNELGNGITKLNYATCESSLVTLDGSWDYLDDNGGNLEVGYVSDALSGNSGYLPTYNAGGILKAPGIRYTWSKPIYISGIRMYFDKHAGDGYTPNLVREGKIRIKDGITYLSNINFSNDNMDEVIDIDVEANGLTEIEFEFTRVYGSDNFVKIPEIQFLSYVDNWGTYLTKNQKIKASFVVNGEEVSMGTYLFDTLEQTNEGMTAKLTAKNYVAQLNEQKYANGAHGTTTLDLALKDVLGGSGVDIFYKVANGGVQVSTATPKDTTKRAAIHYFCQASCCTCYIDRQEKLRVLSLTATGVERSNELNMDNIYSKDITRLSEYVNMIRLTVKDEYTDPETETTYYGGSGLYYREIENNCVAENRGETVANWLLEQKNRRVYFEIQSRGNPASELGDTVKITTEKGKIYRAVIYYQNFSYDGGLKCTLKAVV